MKVSSAPICGFNLYDVELPLRKPYASAISRISTLETFVIEAIDSDGQRGWGEAAIYPGYSQETRADALALWKELLPTSVGTEPDEALGLVYSYVHRQPHAVCAFASAVEVLAAQDGDSASDDVAYPILAAVGGANATELARDVAEAILRGFTVLKLKIGFDPEQDLDRIEIVRTAAAGRALIRLDANQGYSREAALGFVRRLDGRGIELLEQPCDEADWDANAAVAQACPVPVMLDESIFGAEDIRRASKIPNVTIVKLKLVKAGSIARLRAFARVARDLGLRVVIGNGVACELNCWAEARVAAEMCTMAGEMNGFLKPVQRLFPQLVSFSGGRISCAGGAEAWPVDRDALRRVSRTTLSFGQAA